MPHLDIVILTLGMGGSSASDAAVVADIVKESRAIVIAVVSKPFNFEGKDRLSQAEQDIEMLSKKVNMIQVVPYDMLRRLTNERLTFATAYGKADELMYRAVSGIARFVKFGDSL